MAKMTIGKRLTIGFGVMLIVVLGLGGSAVYWTGRLGHDSDETVRTTGKKLALIEELQATLFRMRSCQRGVMLFAMHNLADKVRSNKEELESRGVTLEQGLRELKPTLVTEEGVRVEAEMENQLQLFKEYFEQVAAASMAGKHADALKEYTDFSSKALDTLRSCPVKGASEPRN